MEQHSFSVFYDGDNLSEYAMDAKSVANSISAFVTTFEEINKTVFSDEERPALKLQIVGAHAAHPEAFQAGSFGWDFRVLSDIAGKTANFFTQAQTELAKRFGLQASIFVELAELIKRINGHDIEIKRDTQGNYSVLFDGEEITIEAYQAELLANDKVQSAMKKVVGPLHRDGISNFGITDNIERKAESVLTIDEGDEARSFKGSSGAIIPRIEEVERDVAFFIDTLSYNPTSKWKLVSEEVNSGKPISVTINDAEFLTRVAEHNEAFAKNDVLIATLYQKMVTHGLEAKKATSYTITRVIEHKTASQQGALFLDKL